MNIFLKIQTSGSKTVYVNVTQITKIEPTSSGGTRIALSDTDVIETKSIIEDVLQLLSVVTVK